MSKFSANHRIDLAFVASGWEGAYIEIRVPTYVEMEEMEKNPSDTVLKAAQQMLAYAKDHFVSGQAPVEGKLTSLTVDDLQELPINAIKKLTNVINGEGILPDPKS